MNWYRNAIAAGGCVVVHRGKEYCITGIDTLSREQGIDAYPAPFRQILKAGGRKEFRLLRTGLPPRRDEGGASPGSTAG